MRRTFVAVVDTQMMHYDACITKPHDVRHVILMMHVHTKNTVLRTSFSKFGMRILFAFEFATRRTPRVLALDIYVSGLLLMSSSSILPMKMYGSILNMDYCKDQYLQARDVISQPHITENISQKYLPAKYCCKSVYNRCAHFSIDKPSFGCTYCKKDEAWVIFVAPVLIVILLRAIMRSYVSAINSTNKSQ